MSIFYFDLFVDYLQALIQQGIYSVDDAVVFQEVLGKILLMIQSPSITFIAFFRLK